MPLHSTTRQIGSVTVVDLTGQISFQEAGAVRALLLDLLSKGHKNFILNLRELKYLDSSGIAELVRAYVSVRNRKGELKVMNLTSHVWEVLRFIRLHTILEDFDDEESALRSFS